MCDEKEVVATVNTRKIVSEGQASSCDVVSVGKREGRVRNRGREDWDVPSISEVRGRWKEGEVVWGQARDSYIAWKTPRTTRGSTTSFHAVPSVTGLAFQQWNLRAPGSEEADGSPCLKERVSVLR